jgi:hypothetical protein
VWQEVVPEGWHDTESGWYYTPYDRFADPEGRLEGDEDFQQSYPDFDRRVKLAEIDAVRKPKPVEAGVPPQPKIKKKKKNRGKAQKNALERYEGAAKDKIEAALKSVVSISWVLVTLDSEGPLLRCGDGEVECHLHLSADGTKVRDGNVRLSGEKRGGTQGGVPLKAEGFNAYYSAVVSFPKIQYHQRLRRALWVLGKGPAPKLGSSAGPERYAAFPTSEEQLSSDFVEMKKLYGSS